MKKIILISLLLLSTIVFSQEKKILSNTEIFSAKCGTLIEKQFIEIGECKSIKINVLKVKDLNDGTTFSAIRLEYESVDRYTKTSKISILDKDEIDGLIKSIKNLNSVFKTNRDTYTEITFKSRTGFECGAFYTKKWKTYVKLEKYDSDSMVFLSTDDILNFLSLIEQAKSKM